MQRYDFVVRGGTLVLPWGTIQGDLGISGEKIAALGRVEGTGEQEFDAHGLHVLPGVIDTQVHFREPGAEHKEDLASGSLAAVLGGVTSVFEMPNTNPTTTTAELLDDKLARARGRMHCDHAFFIGATADNLAELPRLERLPGCAGVKIFMGSSTGSLLIEDDATLEGVLRSGRRRVAVHAEDEPRLRARKARAAEGDPRTHPVWRDAEAALLATRRLLAAATRSGRPVHVLHISTADELPLLAEHRAIATVEVTPQHLTLAAPDCYERLGTHAQMNPPVRGPEHRAALWQAIASGLVDVLGSDHAPHTVEEKSKPYPASPSGLPGVQTLLPVMLDHVAAGRLSLERLVELTSAGPSRVYSIAAKGRIALGFDADLVLVDLSARRRVQPTWLASRAGWSPFEGQELTGWPVATVLRGRIIARDGVVTDSGTGRPVRFIETLAG